MKLPQLQEQLRKEKISHLFLFQNDPNFTYFTKLKDLSFSFLVIPSKGKPSLFLTSLDKEKNSKNIKNILIQKPFKTFIKKHLKPKILAYNSLNLTLYSHKKLKKIFPKTKFKDFSSQLQQLRTEKTKQEILYPRKAAKLTVEVFHKIITNLKNKKFQTENDIKFFLQNFAHQNDTELSFPPIVASAKNTRNPHHQTSNQKLKKGFLLLDFGISYKNYCSDMTRMLYLGKPSKKELQLYNFLLTVQQNIIATLRTNISASKIEKKARQNLGEYSSYFIHGLGHGVGVEIHESPSLKPDSSDLIKKNQIFTIEPGIYLQKFGIRIEDTILMKERPVILTNAPKELILINL